MSRFSFSNSADGPYIIFDVGDEELTLDWDKTMLFTHRDIHENKYYDHVFVSMEAEKDDERASNLGAFIWRQVLPDFNDLVNGLITHDYPHLHSPWPNDHDVEQFRDSGLVIPSFREVVTIAEVEDDQIVAEAMGHIDEELKYFLDEQT